MRIGNLEIRFVRPLQIADCKLQIAEATDFSGALAVPDTHPMWKAVHQVLDKSEREIIEAAQKMAGVNNDRALNSLSNSEGVAFIRRRLNEARDGALTRMR